MFDLGTKVLIVDDMKMMRKLVEKSLRDIGFTKIIAYEDGQQAFEGLEAEGDFGLIISDWNMPVLTGIDFLKKVRASDKFNHLPFLLLTAEAEKEQISEAILSGVDNYIIKPFSPNTLREKLEVVHKKKAA